MSKVEISINDIMKVAIENAPSKEIQQAMIDEVELLKTKGLSEAEALSLVFDNNKIGNKPH